ncbi:olfactomedin-like protein 3A [Anguilla rostrata]|uniref:olfactomedin-like protein 3A n=1 Tax=Anguilla rostrata TaxID=7938 RepID=UPI0030CBC38F
MGTFLVLIAAAFCFVGGQHQGLIDYLEQRLVAIEGRISVWHEQSNRYATELLEFKQQMSALTESLEKGHAALLADAHDVGSRVDRLERELDYVETQNPAPPCADTDKNLMEPGIATVKEKNKAEYDKLSHCRDMISSIKAMKIVKKAGGPKGAWFKDTASGAGKVYVFNGTGEGVLYEFGSARDLAASAGLSRGRPLDLPFPWSGTGHAVYRGHAYYVTEGPEFQLIKYDLQNGSVADSAVFPAEDQVPVYGLSPETYIDLSADEGGLWALFATRDTESVISLAKMDPGSLEVEQMWDTPCPRENAEAGFVVCGTAYVVYNTRLASRSRVQCVFDIDGLVSSDEAPLVYFPKRYSTHSSLKYNPLEKLIYAWDDGYQILYKMVMKKKLEV